MKRVAIPTIRLRPLRLPEIRLWPIGRAWGDDAGTEVPPDTQPGAGVSNLLLEGGGGILLEDGGVILLETEVVKQLNV